MKSNAERKLTKPSNFVQKRADGHIDPQHYYDNFQTAAYGSLIDTEWKAEGKREVKEGPGLQQC